MGDDVEEEEQETEELFEDPLNGTTDEIGTDDTTSGFIESVNSGSLPLAVELPVLVDLPKSRGPRGSYKKKSSLSDEDEDYEEEEEDEYEPFEDDIGGKKSGSKSTPKEVAYKCPHCTSTFETLGQMKIHKFAEHENEEKPSYLDLVEAAIMAKKNRKQGVNKTFILGEIMKEPSVDDPKNKATYMLTKALKAGLDKGRLMMGRSGKPGTHNYRLVTKPNRRKVLAKYLRNKKAVDYKDVDDFGKAMNKKATAAAAARLASSKSQPKSQSKTLSKLITPAKGSPDTRNFGRGKRTPKVNNQVFGGVTLLDTDESEDEIVIVSEKITPKTKLKLMQKQIKRTISVTSSHQVKRKVMVGSNIQRKVNIGEAKKEETSAAKAEDSAFDEDADLTCRVCFSSYWYRNHVLEHLKTAHGVKDPEEFLAKKKSSV